MIKLTDKQIDEITELCDKWNDCVPDDMTNKDVMLAVSVFISSYLFRAAEDTATFELLLNEITRDAKREFNYIKQKRNV